MIDTATAILAQSERRLSVTAHNISNISTSGYKRQISFGEMISSGGDSPLHNRIVDRKDDSPGKIVETGNQNDIALLGSGFFVVQNGDRVDYTRQGQFSRDAGGRLVTPDGFALQAAGGGDVVINHADFKISADATLIENGEPTARIAVVEFLDSTSLRREAGDMLAAADQAPVPAEFPNVRQGAFEASNVSMGDEMVAMMEALRRAETGQRLVQVYDDLLGRALTTFGQ